MTSSNLKKVMWLHVFFFLILSAMLIPKCSGSMTQLDIEIYCEKCKCCKGRVYPEASSVAPVTTPAPSSGSMSVAQPFRGGGTYSLSILVPVVCLSFLCLCVMMIRLHYTID